MHILKTLALGWLLLLSCALDSLRAEVAIVTISNRETTYNGNPQGVTVETTPQGIPVQVLYDGSAELPANVGNYSVTATITDPNYEGSESANFAIKKATAQVTISNRETTYNGNSQAVVVETTPQGIPVQVLYLYNGDFYSESLPWGAGNYSVTATITDPNYEGSESANFEIKKLQVPLQIGNLQQTFNGSYLPVSISVPDGQGIPLNLVPPNLNVSYVSEWGYQVAAIGYDRAEGNAWWPNYQYHSAGPTYAGNYTVQVSYDDGNVSCTASATLVVAKGQLSDFLRVPQNYAFIYQGQYGYWPSLYGVGFNYAYTPHGGFNISIDYPSSASKNYSVDYFGYSLNPNSDSWNNYPWNPYNFYFPPLLATLSPDGSQVVSPPWGGPPGGGGGGNGYPYTFTISTSDSNLEGTISVPFGIRQQIFMVAFRGANYEFDGYDRSPPFFAMAGYQLPQEAAVWCNWQNWSDNTSYGSRIVSYQFGSHESWIDEGGNYSSGYRLTRVEPTPILPPGIWSFSVNAGGYYDYYNFNGWGSGSVSISKKSISFRIDQPSSGENLGGGGGGSPGQVTSLQQTEGNITLPPVILSGVVLYDQYGRSISAGPQSYDNGRYNSGTTPPSIQVVYQNNLSNAETVVEYQVPSYAIPGHTGTAMVGDLIYTPVENQPLPPGEYSVRVALPNPELNTTTLPYFENSQAGSSFFDYFYMSNVSTPLATFQVLASHVAPEITSQPTASAIVFGQSLSASVLTGGSASYNGTQVEGVFSYANPQNQPSAGESTQEVTFTPNDTGAYLVVTTSIPVLVEKATPLISETPSAQVMKYGQELSASALSGGFASVSGSFAFSNPAFAPPLGNSVQSIVFIPSDSGNYASVGANVTVTVTKGDPGVSSAPQASAITYGQALLNSVLSGGLVNISGNFSFLNPELVLPAGVTSQAVVFTPDDASSYESATLNVTVQVDKAAAFITTAPTAATINHGQSLSASSLTGGAASVPGGFDFLNPSYLPPSGSAEYGVVFTPEDSANYSFATTNVTVTINKSSTSIVTPPVASAITFGQNLTVSILSGGTANTMGNFTFANATLVPPVGNSTHQVVFIPADSGNYTTASANVSVLVNKAMPTLSTLPTASAISFGQTLSAAVLSGGGANVPGNFTFADGLTVPPAGNGTHALLFTPADSGNYSVSTANITVQVNKVFAAITTLPAASPIRLGQTLANSILTGGLANVPGAFDFANPALQPASGSAVQQIVFNPSDSGNYTATNATVTVLVLDPDGDEDGDGLKNSVETDTGVFVSASDTGTDPLVADTNNDGFADGRALGSGLNPLTDYSAAIALVKQLSAEEPGFCDLYTADAMMDLNLGALTIQKNGQTVTVELQIQSTTNLATQPFTNLGAPVEFQMEMPSNKGFLRVHALGSQ
jgi:hypothetical protein